MSACLHIVGTPIGNLGDMSPRAVETLQRVDLILAEDTRHSRHLCQHFGIRTPLRAWHQHNEEQALASAMAELQQGRSLALISDAGMPLISDPGFPLVRACQEAGIPVRVVPGPAACIAALAISGLPADRFSFEGFLAARTGARVAQLEAVKTDPRTLIFYEAPHRLAASLASCVEVMGPERSAALGRELTKKFETVHRGSLAALAAWAAEDGPDRRGEIVLLIAPAEPMAAGDGPSLPDELQSLARLFHGELPPRKLAKLLARHFDCKTAEVYDFLGELRS